MFKIIKKAARETYEFLDSGSSGAVKDENGNVIGVYDFAPLPWSLARIIQAPLVFVLAFRWSAKNPEKTCAWAGFFAPSKTILGHKQDPHP